MEPQELERILSVIESKIREKDYGTLKHIFEDYSNIPEIQMQKIKLKLQQGHLKEAEDICKKFPDDPKIQSIRITIATRRKDWKKAKSIADRFPENIIMKSQLISLAIYLKDLDLAKEIISEIPEEEKDTIQIQTHLITIAIKEGRFEDAIEICDKYPDEDRIQAKRMKIALEQNDYEKAKEIAANFPESTYIKIHMIDLAIIEKRFHDANNIYTQLQTSYPDNFHINSQLNKRDASLLPLREQHNKILNYFYTCLYYKKMPENFFQYLKNTPYLNDFERTIITLAFSERFNMKLGAEFNTFSTSPSISDKEKSIINKTKVKATSSRRVFDFYTYSDILHWEQDTELARMIETEENSALLNTYWQELEEMQFGVD